MTLHTLSNEYLLDLVLHMHCHTLHANTLSCVLFVIMILKHFATLPYSENAVPVTFSLAIFLKVHFTRTDKMPV